MTPDKDKLLSLLNSTHSVGIPNWTSAELLEAYEMLQCLGFLWFRTEDIASKMKVE